MGKEYNVLLVSTGSYPEDEQAVEIQEALENYYSNPEQYTLSDLEAIFQDRDPFEFL